MGEDQDSGKQVALPPRLYPRTPYSDRKNRITSIAKVRIQHAWEETVGAASRRRGVHASQLERQQGQCGETVKR